MSAFVVGVTGGIGSGKSAVGGLFARHGIAEVDTDRIAHRLTAPGGAAMPAIVAAFGPDAQDADGGLDRAAMRARVFADPAARLRLEAILHPLIRRIADDECVAATSPYVLLLVPLMAETWTAGDYRRRCRRILVVDCSEETQLARVVARSGRPESEVRAILRAQATRGARLAIGDDVVLNEGSLADLSSAVDRLHQHYLMLAGRS